MPVQHGVVSPACRAALAPAHQLRPTCGVPASPPKWCFHLHHSPAGGIVKLGDVHPLNCRGQAEKSGLTVQPLGTALPQAPARRAGRGSAGMSKWWRQRRRCGPAAGQPTNHPTVKPQTAALSRSPAQGPHSLANLNQRLLAVPQRHKIEEHGKRLCTRVAALPAGGWAVGRSAGQGRKRRTLSCQAQQLLQESRCAWPVPQAAALPPAAPGLEVAVGPPAKMRGQEPAAGSHGLPAASLRSCGSRHSSLHHQQQRCCTRPPAAQASKAAARICCLPHLLPPPLATHGIPEQHSGAGTRTSHVTGTPAWRSISRMLVPPSS